jgi:uncharacterized protein (TIGR02147 family)
MSWQQFLTVDKILLYEHERRARRNPSYSLRAFSRDIGLTPAHFNEIIKGRSGLSEAKATLVVKRFGATEAEADWFRLLVQKNYSRSSHTRKFAKKEMSRILAAQRKLNFVSVRRNSFRILSKWYHFAILELFSLKGFLPTSKFIAARLGISIDNAEQALENLHRADLIGKDGYGGFQIRDSNSEVSSEEPEESIREYHRQILAKATESVDLSNDSRELGALSLAFRLSDLDKAKKRIREFRREFNREFGVDREGDEVFCLSVQFFSLTKTRGSRENPT